MILTLKKKKGSYLVRHKDGQLPISRTIESPEVVTPWLPDSKTEKVPMMTPGAKTGCNSQVCHLLVSAPPLWSGKSLWKLFSKN